MRSLPVVRVAVPALLGLAISVSLARPSTGFATERVPIQATTLTFAAEADVRVEEANPGTNYGADPTLRTDGGNDPEVRSYLRFQASGAVGPVTRAVLRVYATSVSDDGPVVYKTDNEWAERELTWNTRPSRTSEAIDDTGAIAAEAWVEYDVTSFVVADGTYSFILVAEGGDGVNFSAREGAQPPRLELTIDHDTGSPPGDGGEAKGKAVTVVAAGDIACDPASGSFKDGLGTTSNCRQEHTARLVEEIAPDLVLGLGDMQYEEGTLANYEESYDPSWGRFKDKTYVVAGGSHDFYGGADFYEYWGERAGPAPLRNWFSRDVGAWHLVFLNSYCDEAGGCEPGSPQYEWLRADLVASEAACTLALWHEPRFTSGARNGEDEDVDPLWDLLYEQGAELVLVGHEHNYERFAPMNGDGERDDAFGVREFVVGTGGKSLGGDWANIRPSSEVRDEETYGVLKLTLRPDGYDWEFVVEPGQSFTDAGSGECHGAPDNGAVERDRSARAVTGLLQSITLHMASPTRRDDAALSFSRSSRRRRALGRSRNRRTQQRGRPQPPPIAHSWDERGATAEPPAPGAAGSGGHRAGSSHIAQQNLSRPTFGRLVAIGDRRGGLGRRSRRPGEGPSRA